MEKLREQIYSFFSNRCNEKPEFERPTYIALFRYFEEISKLINEVITEAQSKNVRSIDIVIRATSVHMISEFSFLKNNTEGEETVAETVFKGTILMRSEVGWVLSKDYNQNYHYSQSHIMRYKKDPMTDEAADDLFSSVSSGVSIVAEKLGVKYIKYIF